MTKTELLDLITEAHDLIDFLGPDNTEELVEKLARAIKELENSEG